MPPIDFNQAVYACAAHERGQWPPDEGAEVAFAGRSNVGKSSAINAIANRNRLAHSSKTPGRTRQIIFFDLDAERRLVDLPGYGYAKVSRDLKRHWEQFVTDYLNLRHCLVGLVIPMDIRRPLTELDEHMLECCWSNNLRVHILLTKADKLSRGRATGILQRVRTDLMGQPQTTVQLFSATKKQGVADAAEVISGWLLEE